MKRRSHSPSGPSRRAFTLLEVILASVIGMMAVLACLGMFAAIDGHSVLGSRRFDEALELERTRETVSRSMQLLIMSDTPMPVAVDGDDTRDEPQDRATTGEEDAIPAEPPPSETPRFDLSLDPSLTMLMVDSTGKAGRPQRFELVLRTQPVFVFDAGEESADPDERLSARERREERERRRADEEALLDLEEDDVAVAPGLRGVFELSFDPGPSPIPGMEGTFSLWWREIGTGAADSAGIAEFGFEAGRILLLSNLTSCRWRVRADDEDHEEMRSTWPDELPAYVFLDVETALGTFHSWLFEVAWSVGKEPGSQTRTALDNTDTAEQPASPDAPANQVSPESEGAAPLDPDSIKPAKPADAPARRRSGPSRGATPINSQPQQPGGKE